MDGVYLAGKIKTDLNYTDGYIGIDAVQNYNNGYLYIRYLYIKSDTNTLNVNKVNGTIYEIYYIISSE